MMFTEDIKCRLPNWQGKPSEYYSILKKDSAAETIDGYDSPEGWLAVKVHSGSVTDLITDNEEIETVVWIPVDKSESLF